MSEADRSIGGGLGAMSDLAAAMARLKSAQKPSRGAPAYSRFINRPLGQPLAAVAYVLGLTPTQVTLLSGSFTAVGIAALAGLRPSWWSSVLVAALLVVGYALDSADGQLARLTGRGSLAGEWLDHFFDSIKAATIHAAVLICWFRFYFLDWKWLLIPVIFGAVASAFFFGVVAADMLRRVYHLQRPDEARPAPTSRLSIGYSLLVLPADYGLLCLLFVTLWQQHVFVVLYTLLAAVNVALLMASGPRWYRSIRTLETSQSV